jgi:DNA (cytosine-5)-methyltransferase 1
MKAIDLFCGCGGLTLGLKNAGYNVVGAVDIEPVAVKTYKDNHPDVHVWSTDIRKLKGQEIFKKLNIRRGQLDLLAGCPPCQGFSRLTTLNGSKIADETRQEQNDLVFEFLRLVRVLRPKAIMMENVPGLYTDDRLNTFLKVLTSLGYHSKREDVVQVLNVADYGVPQRRRRMILMTTRVGKVDFAEPLPVRRTVRNTIADLPLAGESGDVLHDLANNRTEALLQRLADTPINGGSRADLPIDKQCGCHVGEDGQDKKMFRDTYGRMSWDEVSPTMTSGCNNPSKGRFTHPEYNRSITLREAALLQSFPFNYRFSLDKGRTGVALMIGNALPPEFIEVQALQIGVALNRPRKRKKKGLDLNADVTETVY